MYLKQTKQKNGRINLSVVHGYRDQETGVTKHKVIKNFGYVDEYEDVYDDPIAHFKEVAKEMEKERLESLEELVHVGKVNLNQQMELDENALSSLGFLPFSFIFHELALDKFLQSRQRRFKIDFSLKDVLQLLVYSRILDPGSKRKDYLSKDKYPLSLNFEMHDFYRGLDYLNELRENLLLHTHRELGFRYGRNTGHVFYDVSNFFFEIDEEDGLRRKGFCKRNSGKPLVQLGLLLDEDAIPITYQLFKGNTHDSQTLRPVLEETRKTYELGRIITVADKALNSGDNVAAHIVNGDGFIFSQTIRGASEKFKDYVFNPDGYREVQGIVKSLEKDEEEATIFKMKSRAYPQEFWVTHSDGKKRAIALDVKQIVCYNEQYARRQSHKREEAILKAQKIIANPSRYNKDDSAGALRYVANISFDKNTGEVLETKKHPYLDVDKIIEDANYDGYYAIITSEYHMPDSEVVKAYHDLWEIERSFRITKSTLKTRPVYLSTKQRIEAHFLSCFLSLLILRLLARRLDNKYSPEVIVDALREYQICLMEGNLYRVTSYNEVIEDIGMAVGLDLSKRYLTPGKIRSLVAATKKF